jgi:adenine-specific DNA-methyltransferase
VPETRPSTLKKRRGIFYTPSRITHALAQWAVRSARDVALEPSFGGCGFLTALYSQLESLGCADPGKQIFGCDIDPRAFKHLASVIGGKIPPKHFIKSDFLQIGPADFSHNHFDIVIGNPPYVSHHNMFLLQRTAAGAVGAGDSFRLSRKASLWAYFVFHSLTLLKPGGRAAWLLPGSVVHADYAKELLHLLSRRFERVVVIFVNERFFKSNGTQESTQVLLADNFEKSSRSPKVEIKTARNMEQCGKFLRSWDSESWRGKPLNGRVSRTLLRSNQLRAFEDFVSNTCCRKLKDLARVKIGIVTGANRFFVISEETAAACGLPSEVIRPILAKFDVAKGLRLTPGNFKESRQKGERCLLLDSAVAPDNSKVKVYLRKFPKAVRDRNVTFLKRRVWHQPDDCNTPDAFLRYMHHVGPRIAFNDAAVNSTNTVHRVYFRAGISRTTRQIVAIALCTTFSQLSAEIEGRAYGGGVLKHEPNEAMNIQMLISKSPNAADVRRAFRRLHELLKAGRVHEANALADTKIARWAGINDAKGANDSMRAALLRLRARRHKHPLPILA